MIGLDLIGVDEGGLIDAGGGLVKGIVAAFKKKPDQPVVQPGTTAEQPAAPSFWSHAIVGPVRVWHAVLGLAVLVGGVIFWPRRK